MCDEFVVSVINHCLGSSNHEKWQGVTAPRQQHSEPELKMSSSKFEHTFFFWMKMDCKHTLHIQYFWTLKTLTFEKLTTDFEKNTYKVGEHSNTLVQ